MTSHEPDYSSSQEKTKITVSGTQKIATMQQKRSQTKNRTTISPAARARTEAKDNFLRKYMY